MYQTLLCVKYVCGDSCQSINILVIYTNVHPSFNAEHTLAHWVCNCNVCCQYHACNNVLCTTVKIMTEST